MGKDHKKSRREERDNGSQERDAFEEKELYKESEKDRRVSGRDRREYSVDNEKDKHKDKVRDKDYDQRDRYRDKEREREKDYKDRGRDKDRERDRETEKEHNDRGRERKDKEKERERPKDKEREKHKDREREKEKEKDKDRGKLEREKEKDKDREKSERDKGKGKDREREREKDKSNGKNRDGGHEKIRDDGNDERGDRDHGRASAAVEEKQINDVGSGGPKPSTSELEQRILKMREDRLKEKEKEKSEVSEVLSWVSKSRKLEDKMHAEKKKALHLSRVFEEQDNNVLGESDDEKPPKHNTKDLAGMKILHGLDKVVEGGAVILTLKDQNILAAGDINDEVDMLENVEIGEQKQRDDAYKAGKKKTGTYDDKFNEEFGAEKKLLPQYDEPKDESITLDASGRFTGEAEKKLEELRKRIQGDSTKSGFADLTSSLKISSDYYTQDEMLQFKKPKKKKPLRKKDKLDLDALEAEAKSAGLGMEDLGSRKDGKRQTAKEEQQRSEAQMRNNAYQSAYAKAEEASKALRQELPSTTRAEENDDPVFGDEDEDFYKSLEKARRLVLRKQHDTTPSGPQAVASLALSFKQQSEETPTPASGEAQENKVVFTEMEEFVWGLQLNEETPKPEGEDMYMDEEDEVVKSPEQETKVETSGGWTEVSDDVGMGENHPENKEKNNDSNEKALVEKIVGKGLAGALDLLQKRGDLKETVEWGGRNMDKKKSKLVGIHETEGPREINIERLDEFGRVMTPKEAFRMISHKFHGKGPGKGKLEKRMKQYEEEMKLKQMKNSETPSHSVERMRDTQARSHLPYIVLTGNVKSGQSSDPSSGFDTIGDLPGGLTPMLGDRKVEHFLGIKRKGDAGSMGPPKRQRPN